MSRLEIIRLQTGTDRATEAQRVLEVLARDVRSGGAGPDFTDAVLYRHAAVPGLFALFIRSCDDGDRSARSRVAQQIAGTARGFGLVSHSAWVRGEDANRDERNA